MAPLPVIADTFRVVLRWQGSGGLTAVSVMHVRSSTANELDIWTSMDANWTIIMLSLQESGLNCIGVDITKLDGTSGTQSFPAPTLASGSGGADGIAQAASILSFKTALRGAANRGRIFLPFVAEAEQNNGVLNASQVIAANGGWASFQAALAGDGIDMVVASYVHANAHTITTMGIKSIVGTQKRRVDRLR